MAIIVFLAFFILFFSLLRRHTGPMQLATIAGVAVFNSFGPTFLGWITAIFPHADQTLFSHLIYLALVLVFPFILYFNSAHGGFAGIFHTISSVVSAIILVSLISSQIAYFFPFDDLSAELCQTISAYHGPLLLGGVVMSYVDILFYL
ncbi:MAG: hypothetical protein GX853_10295 [Chloroflexi bacterium]|nr:hypothetical protein [Chloroflexota bacterium]